MEHRELGASGLSVSVLALGSWRTWERIERADAVATLVAAREAGINLLDTARYHDAAGLSEVVFGEIFRASGWPRDEVTIANKLWWEFWPEQSVADEIDASLQRTGLDHFDVIYSDPPPTELAMDEVVHAVTDLLWAGKARAWGVVNWPAEWIAEAREFASPEPCAAQLPYNLVQRSPVEDEDMIEALGPMSVVASFVLAGGALTGKYPGATGRLSASSTTRATRRRCGRPSGCATPGSIRRRRRSSSRCGRRAWRRSWSARRRPSRFASWRFTSNPIRYPVVRCTSNWRGTSAGRSSGSAWSRCGGCSTSASAPPARGRTSSSGRRRRSLALGTRGWLLLGLIVGGARVRGLRREPRGLRLADGHLQRLGSWSSILVGAGVLIGFGAKTAGGCTSGNGLSGNAILSPAALVATGTFFGTAIARQLPDRGADMSAAARRAFAVGAVFGLTLSWSGMTNPDVLRDGLLFRDPYLMLFFALGAGDGVRRAARAEGRCARARC